MKVFRLVVTLLAVVVTAKAGPISPQPVSCGPGHAGCVCWSDGRVWCSKPAIHLISQEMFFIQ